MFRAVVVYSTFILLFSSNFKVFCSAKIIRNQFIDENIEDADPEHYINLLDPEETREGIEVK
ncbi:hypothetical protein QYM36_016556 [Artemia franciscana]|uniref:Uncharacterized protein n=1 Tax=Artemia franciscana TaxID=6661 RepID=A0AA88HJK6_ARTSF|nr:hypothetical protein QYM36_016556 [Artemia franciscana]